MKTETDKAIKSIERHAVRARSESEEAHLLETASPFIVIYQQQPKKPEREIVNCAKCGVITTEHWSICYDEGTCADNSDHRICGHLCSECALELTGE